MNKIHNKIHNRNWYPFILIVIILLILLLLLLLFTFLLPKSGKVNITTHFYRQGSLGLLWFITLIIGWAHKIPILKTILGFLGLWYGRTTWWQMFGHIRKAFVVFNAVIGLLVMLNITDFSMDNIIGGIYGLSYSYFEVLKSFIRKVSLWFVRLFIPNPLIEGCYPDKTTSSRRNENPNHSAWGWWWSARPDKSGVHDVLDVRSPEPSVMKDTINRIYGTVDFSHKASSVSWFPDWVWYGGLTLLGIGVLFVGYKLITDPYSIAEFITPNKSGRRGGSTGAGPDIKIDEATTSASSAAAEDIAEGVGEAVGSALFSWFTPISGIRYIGSSVIGGAASGFKKNVVDVLNPFNWTTSNQTHRRKTEDFVEAQDALNPFAEKHLYPYTSDNPHDNWSTRFLKAFFGETKAEFKRRAEHEKTVWERYNDEVAVTNSNNNVEGRVANIESEPETTTGLHTHSPFNPQWHSGANTPIGLGPTYHADNTIHEATRLLNAKNKLGKLGETPADIVDQDLSKLWAAKDKPKASTSGIPVEVKSEILTAGVENPRPNSKLAEETTQTPMGGAPGSIKIDKPTSNTKPTTTEGKHPDLDSPTEGTENRPSNTTNVKSDDTQTNSETTNKSAENPIKTKLNPNEPTGLDQTPQRFNRKRMAGEDPGSNPSSPIENEEGFLKNVLDLFDL